MANSQIKQNQIPNDPTLKDLLSLLKKDLMLNLNAHHLATINSFDKIKQTATATINYKKTFFQPNALGVYEPKLVDYPILIDCPVICLGGGDGALTFPIENGDECLVIFNDRDIDNWFMGSSNSSPATARLHSFSDGIILVGVRSLANVLTDYDDDSVALRMGDNKIRVYEDKVSIQVGEGTELVVKVSGKITLTNVTGEFFSALKNMLEQSYTVTLLGNQPLVFPVPDLAIFNSFVE